MEAPLRGAKNLRKLVSCLLVLQNCNRSQKTKTVHAETKCNALGELRERYEHLVLLMLFTKTETNLLNNLQVHVTHHEAI